MLIQRQLIKRTEFRGANLDRPVAAGLAACLDPRRDLRPIGRAEVVGRFEGDDIDHDNAPKAVEDVQRVDRREMHKRAGIRQYDGRLDGRRFQ